MGFRVSAGKAVLSAALAVVGVVATPVPAAAGEYRYFSTYAFGSCDRSTGEWVIDWQLINQSDEVAAITAISATPAEWPITGLPESVDAGATAHATQRLAGTPGLTSNLVYTSRWADGTSSFNNWSFRPRTVCTKA